MSNRKVRGVKCSRRKLDAALAASSITKKTQIALAEAVADFEGLESVPKDLINKMFRELPVDSQTVERVAKILGVEAKSLLLASEKKKHKQEGEVIARVKSSSFTIYFIFLFVFILAAVFWLVLHQSDKPIETTQCLKPITLSEVSSNKLRIVVGRFQGDKNNQAQLLLASLLASNEKLNKAIDIYTSCFYHSFKTTLSIREQLEQAHKTAKQELIDYQAQLILWGERYDNRLNIRFTSTNNVGAIKPLLLLHKKVQINELDFSLNLRLNDEDALSNDLPILSISMLTPEKPALKAVKEKLLEQFSYYGNWLKEAVLSENNLLKRISPNDDPVLYQLTLTQLCYRQRLLGDMQASLKTYIQAEEACTRALNFIDKNKSLTQWARLTTNLATVFVRKHLFFQQKNERVETLLQAKNLFESVKDVFDHDVNPLEAGRYYQNFAAVFIRLAEFEPTKEIEHLMTAMRFSQRSLQLSLPEDNPLSYAQKLQNQCALKYRLAIAKQYLVLATSATEDCKKAKALIQPKKNPRQWAMIQNNLAVSYAIQAELLNDPNMLTDALNAFTEAQTIYTKKRYPVNWAEVEINKAELTCKLSIMMNNAKLMDNAKLSAQAAQMIVIEKNIGAYQAYIEKFIAKIRLCDDKKLQQCECANK